MICEYCNIEIEQGKAICWDLNWLHRESGPDEEIPEEELDRHSFCSIDHLEAWQKRGGYYDEAKKKSIKRSGDMAPIRLASGKKSVLQDLHHRRSKNRG